MDITVVDKRPNILFAISDDQYYSHTSFVGSKFINAPAFDRISKEGLYFTHCYAGSPDCAPSRSAIVTGRHHWQHKQSGLSSLQEVGDCKKKGVGGDGFWHHWLPEKRCSRVDSGRRVSYKVRIESPRKKRIGLFAKFI